MQGNELYMISSSYPFGRGEEFVAKELKELSKYFSKIHLFPLSSTGEKRWLPDNVELNLSLAEVSRTVPKKKYLSHFFLLVKVLGTEITRSGKAGFVLKNLRELANSLLQAKILAGVFLKQVKTTGNTYFYSVWMDDGALVLSLLKSGKKIPHSVFRLHGYDLFDERRKGNYMPFRYFNFSKANRIFILSQAGYDYLSKKNIFREKLVVNYSGLYDQGTNPFDPNGKFTIVSCSNVIALKRLDKIIDSLSLIDFPVKWIHFGDGELLGEMKNKAGLLPRNIEVDFKGRVSNEEIIAFYREVSVNLFIHLSDTEGLGMAIVEAQGFGIPALAIGVDGVPEVVNNETGILLAPGVLPEEIADAIRQVTTGNINTPSFRKGVKNHCSRKFDAEKNYLHFYNLMTSSNQP